MNERLTKAIYKNLKRIWRGNGLKDRVLFPVWGEIFSSSPPSHRVWSRPTTYPMDAEGSNSKCIEAEV
jgi:hypothetical protein